MRPALRHLGSGRAPLVVVDDFSGDPAAVISIAAALAPFPGARGNLYPGVRRVIREEDAAAWDYVRRTLEAAAPFIAGAFDLARFDLVEASFSMVTARPETLAGPQRAPHFDSPDPDHLAVLHYLSPTEGTAFYRQLATGIEVVDAANMASFVRTARQGGASHTGYIRSSNASFEQVASVEGFADRLIVYQGCLLHSGIIAPDMPFSSDPRQGRLTANFFVQGHRG